ncbi:MAG: DUF2207 domain-containing protein [Prevotella sp.]|nr:DUF2207 domain-containing protein [Prevotella sp.]
MKHLRNNVLLLMLLASATCVFARPQLRDLNIQVVVEKNGDARITETRTMDIDSEGTECYIVIGNLNGSELRDFGVSDETGQTYEYLGSWDIDRSRGYKTNKCGIVTKHDGYELCWGLGENGSRTYTTRYTITRLVKGYSDADGFNYMFVAQGMSPQPEHVRLTIETADTTRLVAENTGIWGFRYRGDINMVDGAIVAESSEPFESRSAMIVMCRFSKGLFEPADVRDGSFEDVKNRAFEGSDYVDEDEWTKEDTWTLIALVAGFVIFPVLLVLGQIIYVWRARRKVNKDLMWYRDIPYNGNLQRVNDVLNAYKYFNTDYNNLLSACILKLINLGGITIEQSQNDKGQFVQNFVIHDLKDKDRQPKLLKQVHNIFKQAAGNDTILEPKELKSYMKSKYNQSITDSFITTLHTKTSISQYKNELEDVRQVFGLKKYLQEFSLIDERHVSEVSLWKEYMIFATLFGIADQVIKDMKKINPEYFNMDQVAQQMADDMTLPTIYSTMHSSTTRAAMSKAQREAEREARASGHGGHSSWGGGGGFSGGGFGGGVR